MLGMGGGDRGSGRGNDSLQRDTNRDHAKRGMAKRGYERGNPDQDGGDV